MSAEAVGVGQPGHPEHGPVLPPDDRADLLSGRGRGTLDLGHENALDPWNGRVRTDARHCPFVDLADVDNHEAAGCCCYCCRHAYHSYYLGCR